jgi:catalase (peroxidase I)
MLASLSGVHTIGSAKKENSGYEGGWGTPQQQSTFDNSYYKNMVARGWGPNRGVGGNPDRNQWKIIDEGNSTEKA